MQPQVDQQFTWSPNIAVTVQGDVKDPDQLARDLVTRMRPHFEEIARQAMGRQLFDAPTFKEVPCLTWNKCSPG